jgi:hypothetical protein
MEHSSIFSVQIIYHISLNSKSEWGGIGIGYKVYRLPFAGKRC